MNERSEQVDVSVEMVQEKIFLIRGKKVMLDKDLSTLYEVATRNLNKAVERNLDRFPDDFAFRLTHNEFKNLMFQIGTSSWGGRRKLPYVFTEQGVAMLSSVLRSKRAIEVNIQIMRVFIKLRDLISSHKDLAQKIQELELRVEGRLNIHDSQIISLFEKIRELLSLKEEDQKVKSPMGFPIKQTTQNKRKYDAAT